MFQWRPNTSIRAASKIVTIYCKKCLEHFGAITCPTTRGVKAFKKSKIIRDHVKLVPRRADMLEWFHGPHDSLEVMLASIRPIPVLTDLSPDIDAVVKET